MGKTASVTVKKCRLRPLHYSYTKLTTSAETRLDCISWVLFKVTRIEYTKLHCTCSIYGYAYISPLAMSNPLSSREWRQVASIHPVSDFLACALPLAHDAFQTEIPHVPLTWEINSIGLATNNKQHRLLTSRTVNLCRTYTYVLKCQSHRISLTGKITSSNWLVNSEFYIRCSTHACHI